MAPAKSLREHLDYIRAHPEDFGSLTNTIDDMLVTPEVPQGTKDALPGMQESVQSNDNGRQREARNRLIRELEVLLGVAPPLPRAPRADDAAFRAAVEQYGLFGGVRRSQTKRFNSCVKAVRKSVKARKGSSKESAAIAICTKTILHPRGRTIKRYKKGRLVTQKRK